MDLTFTPRQEAFRVEARAWLEQNVPREPLALFDTAEGFEQHRAWERMLHDAGWSVVSWPREYGGRGASLTEWLIFEEEYWAAGAPGRVNQNGIFLLGPTLMEWGSNEQKRRFLPRIASSEDVWCQGWSEPNVGSDLAAIEARAARAGDTWVLNGQKTWCSRGAFAGWMFGMFRSDTAAKRHEGLTYILVPLDADGVTVRPIAQLDGTTGFAEIFLDDVRVPIQNTLGPEGQGWKVAMSTAGFERGVYLRSPGRFMATARRLLDLARNTPGAPASLRDAAVRGWMDAEAYRLYQHWTVTRFEQDGAIGFESSINKIFWSEMDVRMHQTALELLGSDANAAADWWNGFWFSLAGPIYAGTNEIQRNIIAERILGLPKG